MRLIVFDLDGTLVDSEALIVASVTEAFRAVNEPVPDVGAIRAISGITARDALAILAPGADEARVDVLLESYVDHYHRRSAASIEPLFEGALELLDRLQASPETILAVATGKGYAGAVTLLERHGIIDRFNSIETPTHNRGKPDPEMVHTAMNKAGVDAAHTVMLGDTVHDMRMAKAAGVKALGVAWGYHEAADLELAGADIVVRGFSEVDARIDELVGAVDA
ncbi:MAG: HAD-IA family hydrolase [Devosia sp.]|jgi:phosphoglycolate phosphatase